MSTWHKSFPHLKAGWRAWPIAVGRGLNAGKGTITVVVYGHNHGYHCCRPLSTLWKETKYTGCMTVSIALESHILKSWFACWKWTTDWVLEKIYWDGRSQVYSIWPWEQERLHITSYTDKSIGGERLDCNVSNSAVKSKNISTLKIELPLNKAWA